MNRSVLWVGLIFIFALVGCSNAEESDNGQEQAPVSEKPLEQLLVTCVGCHGRNGISTLPMYPNLAGQKAQYMILQLKAFRSGERINPIMTPFAKKLTDKDIERLSEHFASLPLR